jgi:hypothetical protein
MTKYVVLHLFFIIFHISRFWSRILSFFPKIFLSFDQSDHVEKVDEWEPSKKIGLHKLLVFTHMVSKQAL